MAILNPTRLADLGRKLYADLFEPVYALDHQGEILAIEVQSKTAYLGKSGGEALRAGIEAHPDGFFHILRIGGGGVYKVPIGRSDARGWFL